MDSSDVRRLSAGDGKLACSVFAMMSAVFGEDTAPPGQDYVERLLCREDFWALSVFEGDEPVGGLTAYTLPMTRSEMSEVFIYDIAVAPAFQRRGIGRRLINALRDMAAGAGVSEIFVPADNDDTHALDFYRAIGGEASQVTFFTFSQKMV